MQELAKLQEEARELKQENQYLHGQLRKCARSAKYGDDTQLTLPAIFHMQTRSSGKKEPRPPAMKESVQQLRAREKAQIMRELWKYKEVLLPFDQIVIKCLRGRRYPEFLRLTTVSDFSDGFKMRTTN